MNIAFPFDADDEPQQVVARIKARKSSNAQSLPVNADDELQRVVARIKARKPSQAPLSPSPAVRAAVVAHLYNEETLTSEELDRYEREWDAVEDEMRAVERSGMYKERWI